MRTTGIRNLKDNLSRYIARAAAGDRVVITDRGRPVAELVPPAKTFKYRSRHDELVASGVIRPALEAGDPFADWPTIKLPKGTAAALIDEDRAERDER
jgi:prevent-host-death family protein